MIMSRNVKLLVVPALAALALGTAATGRVAAAAPAGAMPAGAVPAGAAVSPEDLHLCQGKAQISATVLTRSAAETIGENVPFVPITDASVLVNGPAAAAATDQLIVTFTGEAALDGQPNVLNPAVDSLQVRLLVNGVPLPPGAVAFTTDAGQSDAVQGCTLVTGPGPHVVTAQWRLFDFANNNALTGTLNSWELHVEQND
jgi:hypothetical protein